MKTSSFQKRNAYLLVGGIGLFFAAGYLGISFQLPFGQMDQPGAAVFPVIVGVMLMLASLALMWEGWQLDKINHLDLPTGAGRKRLMSLLGFLLGYFLVLPWLGDFISSTLFCLLMMRVLSDIGWPRIMAYSLAMSIALHVVFVFLLKVPMPRGLLEF